MAEWSKALRRGNGLSVPNHSHIIRGEPRLPNSQRYFVENGLGVPIPSHITRRKPQWPNDPRHCVVENGLGVPILNIL